VRPPPPSSLDVTREASSKRRTSEGNPDDEVARLQAELAHERRISEALRDVGIALGATLDLDELLELILVKITEAVEADRATLYLLDEGENELVSRVVQGDDVKSIRLKVGDGVAGHVARTGKPLHVKDAYKDSRFNPEADRASGYKTKSILAVPMKNHLGRIIGVVQVLNKVEGEFTDADAVVLTSLATQAAISIDNSRLFSSVTQKNMQLVDIKEQLEHRVRDLNLLFDLESSMGRAASLEELVDNVLREGARLLRAQASGFLLKDHLTGALSLHALSKNSKKLKHIPMDRPLGFVGHAFHEAEIVFNNSVKKNDPHYGPNFDAIFGFQCSGVIAVPIDGEDGEPMGALAVYSDGAHVFTEEDRALLILIASNAQAAIHLQLSRESREREDRLSTIGRLLSGVIHDLKTPLGVISGYVQMLPSEPDPKVRAEYGELALKQFDHIGAMQREVLEFARGERTVLVRKVYLQQFFANIERDLTSELARKRVLLHMKIDDRGTARFDEAKITRIIHNLARNAAEAMAPTGGGDFTIHVVRDSSNAVVMTFKDNGPGIPKEIAHRLFQSFVTSGKKGGTGLGLAISKKIAEEHGGSLTVKSSSRGATFTLKLPQNDE